ncbi:MAG TPA: hypothetical protein VKN76_02825 [Kiloniellaceae bacterium]|nr:hypothetical protein [Kiloniellaceae bacterium]
MNDFPKLLDPDRALARKVFDQLAEATRLAGGARAAYGDGEQEAQEILRRAGEFLGLEVHSDAALNLYLTYPGAARELPAVIIGGHLDLLPTRESAAPAAGLADDPAVVTAMTEAGDPSLNVPGGAVGLVAGLAVFAGFRRLDFTPPCDITLLALRGGEAGWFRRSHIGAFAAFGELPSKYLTARRVDSDRSLADHMAAAGCNLEAIRAGEAYLQSAGVRAYIQVTLDPGSALLHADRALGLADAVRGCLRYRDARCVGAGGPVGALTREERRDAVMATAGLIHHLDQIWSHFEAGHQDLTIAVPRFELLSAQPGLAQLASEVAFALDFRAKDEQALHRVARRATQEAARLEAVYDVRFDLGPEEFREAAAMDPGILDDLGRLAEELAIPVLPMTGTGGQDAVVFANFGVPSALLFVRNRATGSLPQEAMATVDFAAAARLLSAYLVTMLD